VWFYDVDADGMSLDDKRTELLPPEKLGPVPKAALTADDHAKNNLPDILARWAQRDKAERKNARTAQSFCVPKTDIAAQGYDLSLIPAARKRRWQVYDSRNLQCAQVCARSFPPGWEARLYARQGCLTLPGGSVRMRPARSVWVEWLLHYQLGKII
jgi:hypothetical protein